jgi:hypothetical protein
MYAQSQAPSRGPLGPQEELRRSYKRWEEKHSRLMQEPPREGKDYINHALKILPFIEAMSELHSTAKG